MTDAVVVGASGYAGAELVRLVAGHPRLRVVGVTSDADSGRQIADLYPALAGVDLTFVPHAAALDSKAEVAFLAVPHTAAMALAPALLDAGMTVVDASADFRLADPTTYEQWYGTPHTAPALLEEAVYGLPELWREDLAGAKLVACPGCYPTASLLAAVPAVEAGLASAEGIVIDAKSGVSGAGRGLSAVTHFCSANESMAPYGVTTHRHTPEIEQGLARAGGGSDVRVTFTPHLAPMTRGLLATVYLRAPEGLKPRDAYAVYAGRYAEEPFVTVHPLGRMPATGEVRGGNRAHLGVAVDERTGTLIVACAIDNLVKGTSGQAVQCANLALGFGETEGLAVPAPVL